MGSCHKTESGETSDGRRRDLHTTHDASGREVVREHVWGEPVPTLCAQSAPLVITLRIVVNGQEVSVEW